MEKYCHREMYIMISTVPVLLAVTSVICHKTQPEDWSRFIGEVGFPKNDIEFIYETSLFEQDHPENVLSVLSCKVRAHRTGTVRWENFNVLSGDRKLLSLHEMELRKIEFHNDGSGFQEVRHGSVVDLTQPQMIGTFWLPIQAKNWFPEYREAVQHIATESISDQSCEILEIRRKEVVRGREDRMLDEIMKYWIDVERSCNALQTETWFGDDLVFRLHSVELAKIPIGGNKSIWIPVKGIVDGFSRWDKKRRVIVYENTPQQRATFLVLKDTVKIDTGVKPEDLIVDFGEKEIVHDWRKHRPREHPAEGDAFPRQEWKEDEMKAAVDAARTAESELLGKRVTNKTGMSAYVPMVLAGAAVAGLSAALVLRYRRRS